MIGDVIFVFRMLSNFSKHSLFNEWLIWEKFPLGLEFEYSVPSWWHCFAEGYDILGDVAFLDKA